MAPDELPPELTSGPFDVPFEPAEPGAPELAPAPVPGAAVPPGLELEPEPEPVTGGVGVVGDADDAGVVAGAEEDVGGDAGVVMTFGGLTVVPGAGVVLGQLVAVPVAVVLPSVPPVLADADVAALPVAVAVRVVLAVPVVLVLARLLAGDGLAGPAGLTVGVTVLVLTEADCGEAGRHVAGFPLR